MQTQDTITVAPAVLIAIARQITLNVKGVAEMGITPGGMGRLIRRTSVANGVRIDVDNNAAYIDLYIVLEAGHNLRDVCHEVQREVTRNMEEIVGLDVIAVDVHVEDVDFTSASSEA